MWCLKLSATLFLDPAAFSQLNGLFLLFSDSPRMRVLSNCVHTVWVNKQVHTERVFEDHFIEITRRELLSCLMVLNKADTFSFNVHCCLYLFIFVCMVTFIYPLPVSFFFSNQIAVCLCGFKKSNNLLLCIIHTA